MTPTPAPTNTPVPLICVKFFYDGNMSGSKEENEPFLTPSVRGYKLGENGCYYIPEGKVKLYITGKAPNGKDLLNATLDWPNAVNLLPAITIDTKNTQEVGLVDGFCSSPIRPEDLYWEEYNRFIANPDLWFELYTKYFEGAEEGPNWLFYGYKLPGKSHKAFDIWAKPGTPVYAPVPGKIIGISENHAIHIRYADNKLITLGHITPAVKKGDYVQGGEIVGYIKEGEGNHVHMEPEPDGSLLLKCFAGFSRDNLLINPRQGPPPVLPYFGR